MVTARHSINVIEGGMNLSPNVVSASVPGDRQKSYGKYRLRTLDEYSIYNKVTYNIKYICNTETEIF